MRAQKPALKLQGCERQEGAGVGSAGGSAAAVGAGPNRGRPFQPPSRHRWAPHAHLWWQEKRSIRVSAHEPSALRGCQLAGGEVGVMAGQSPLSTVSGARPSGPLRAQRCACHCRCRLACFNSASCTCGSSVGDADEHRVFTHCTLLPARPQAAARARGCTAPAASDLSWWLMLVPIHRFSCTGGRGALVRGGGAGRRVRRPPTGLPLRGKARGHQPFLVRAS